MNRAAKCDPIAVFSLLKRMNGSGFAKEAPRSLEIVIQVSNCLELFTNILKSMLNQRMMFNLAAVLGLFEMMNGSDLHCVGPTKIRKWQKPALYTLPPGELRLRISGVM